MMALDQAIARALSQYMPRSGFAAELLASLQRASQTHLYAVPADPSGGPWWVAGGAAGVLAAVGGAALAWKRRGRRRSA